MLCFVADSQAGVPWVLFSEDALASPGGKRGSRSCRVFPTGGDRVGGVVSKPVSERESLDSVAHRSGGRARLSIPPASVTTVP